MVRIITALTFIQMSFISAASATEPVIPEFTIYFPCNNSKLNLEGESVITKAWPVLSSVYSKTVGVIGHSYSADSDDTAMALSKERALSVKDELIKRGIPAKYLNVAWVGKSDKEIPDTKSNPEPRNCRTTLTVFAGPLGH